MRQALHIFRKDVRHLWPNIAIVLAATAALALEVAGEAASLTDPQTTQGVALAWLSYLLPTGWWALVARLVYDEPPAGDQPFWLTRPYSRTSLLAAKALFIGAFVNLPAFAGDIVILRAWGFGIWPELGGLLWRQVLLTALFVLPVAALCAVTTGFAQLITATVILGLLGAGWYMAMGDSGAGVPWLALEWIRSYSAFLVIAVAALAIVAWQYVRRDTTKSRFAVGGAFVSAVLVLSFLSWPAAFALQSRLSRRAIDVSRIDVGFDTDRKWRALILANRDDTVDIQIPLRITPAPTLMRPEGISATIEGPGGAVWRSGQQSQRNLLSQGQLTSIYVRLGSVFYNQVKNAPVRIHGSLYMTLYGNPRAATLPVSDRPVLLPTPGVGLCSAGQTAREVVLNCRSTFKSRPDFVTFQILGRSFVTGAVPHPLLSLTYPQPGSYSPFPADANLIPVSRFVQASHIYVSSSPVVESTYVRAVAMEPVAHIRKDFEITGVRLADFELAK